MIVVKWEIIQDKICHEKLGVLQVLHSSLYLATVSWLGFILIGCGILHIKKEQY